MILPALIVLAGLTTAGIKALDVAAVPSEVDMDWTADGRLARISDSAAAVGLRVSDGRAIGRSALYRLISITDPDCSGTLDVMVLHRNGEGARLLEVVRPGQPVKFWFKGKTSASFPATSVWWVRSTAAISTVVWGQAAVPLIITFTESGACGLAERFFPALREVPDHRSQ